MKNKLKQEKGVTMVALVVTIIILIILTSVLVFNTQDSVYIKKINNLYSDIEVLRIKTDEYYNEYGKIPANIKYTNISSLASVLSTKNDIGDFYVIDLEAMKGITLNYGKDYENVKINPLNADSYKDLYIINENSHNIFYVKGIDIKEKDAVKTYYTDYRFPDDTTVDIKYITGILIPDNYYYIGNTKDGSGNESIVISNNKEESVDLTKSNQYIWTKQISEITEVPSSVTLENNQESYQFIISVNNYKGYFKNKDGKVVYIVVDEEKWSEAYTKDTEYEDKNGDTIIIPAGFKVSMADTMNTIKKGFVVKDENDNEWVWIEVPSNVFITSNNDTDYENIEADLIRYAKDYRKGASSQNCDWKDTWHNGCGLNEEEYTKTYHTMLSSVYNNNGFWISRYNIGDSSATENNYEVRSKNSGTLGKTASKKSQVPYNFVTTAEAQKLASKMSNQNKTSSLLFGIQWDLVCKFLEENLELTYEDIAVDSSQLGNYSNSSLKLVRGKYLITSNWIDFKENTQNYVTNSQTSINESYNMLLTTGSSEKTRKLNIYDLAGNIYKLTLENTYSGKYSMRGGRYGVKGNVAPMAYRTYTSEERQAEIGFRVSIY